jgi:hypothetical protein
MADLSDFLGHILEEITRARVSADAEAVRTAKLYAADPDGLLKHFAVPRVRLPNVEITAPMIVTAVPSGYVEKTDPDLLSRTVAADLSNLFAQRRIAITTTDITDVIKADPALSKGYLNPSAPDSLSVQIGERMKAPSSRTKSASDSHAQVVALIREQLVQTLQSLPLSPAGIGIDATTAAVRDFNPAAGQGANVVYVKMSISEDALEIEFEPPAEPVPGQPPPAPVIRRLSPE